MKDFDAEFDLDSKQGIEFKLAGHEFHTKGFAPAAAYLQHERGVRYAIHFLRSVLIPDDREIFDKLVNDPDSNVAGDQVDEIALWVMGEISTRPTVSPAKSGGGADTASD